jgi:tRNA(fMet)-specific endonuclease VapC
MVRYMLDADTVSYALRGQGGVAERLLEHRPSDLCISSVTLAELEFGAEAERSKKLRQAVRAFVNDVQVAPFDESAAQRFGSIAASLSRRGRLIGTFDTLVAAHGLSLGVSVVTNNTKHFRQVAGLKVENWA